MEAAAQSLHGGLRGLPVVHLVASCCSGKVKFGVAGRQRQELPLSGGLESAREKGRFVPSTVNMERAPASFARGAPANDAGAHVGAGKRLAIP